MQVDATNVERSARQALDQGDPERAVFLAREAVRHAPGMWQPVHTLALSFEKLQRYDVAAVCFRQTLQLCPGHPDAHVQLMGALLREGRALDAEAEAYQRLRQHPYCTGTWCNLGLALRQQRRTAEAIAAYRTGLQHAPQDASLHWNLSLALLAAGEFKEGWREFEWRVAAGISPATMRDEPLWQGEPLEGKSLLLETEQGLGDTIQFLRYAPWLEQQGARVVVDCQLRLRPLCGRWLAQEPIDYDFRAPLMSLPLLTGGVVPCYDSYLEARAAELGEGFKIGLCWSGNPANVNDRFRSIPFDLLSPLTARNDVRWFLLDQKPGDTVGQLASTLCGLDLVISADTMVAHLAGALGRPVWTLLSYAPDWRWLDEGDSSSWYRTMRLFRQTSPGDWKGVIERVSGALSSALAVKAFDRSDCVR